MKKVAKGKKEKPLFKKIEIKIIQLICRQFSNEEMADKLGVSRRSVESYREYILIKTKAKNSIGIVVYAVKHGMFKIKVEEE